MLSHWTIKFLHLVFVFSLGAVTLRLFYESLASEKVRRPSPSKRAELLLRISRDGSTYMSLPLRKGHYRIGRGPECDILLKGQGIPLDVGKIYRKDGEYFFQNYPDNSVVINGELIDGETALLPHDDIKLYNYTVQVRNQ